jgi:hypothetical protein
MDRAKKDVYMTSCCCLASFLLKKTIPIEVPKPRDEMALKKVENVIRTAITPNSFGSKNLVRIGKVIIAMLFVSTDPVPYTRIFSISFFI